MLAPKPPPVMSGLNRKPALLTVAAGAACTVLAALSSWVLYTQGALLLAVSSSTDNLAVGFSLGLAGHPLPVSTNLIVSSTNTLGMVLASFGGQLLHGAAPQLGGALGGCIFLYLGAGEIWSIGGSGQQSSPLASLYEKPWLLALPMTLNNIAGGVAAGLSGEPPGAVAVLTFLMSLTLMAAGWVLGCTLEDRTNHAGGVSNNESKATRAASWGSATAGGIFVTLGIIQLKAAFIPG